MSLNYTPRTDRVIVKRLPKPETKPGEVIIPGSQQKPPDEGIVMAVGPQVGDLRGGDQVLFLEFAGTPVEIDGEQYLSMREQEVHGVRGQCRCFKCKIQRWMEGQMVKTAMCLLFLAAATLATAQTSKPKAYSCVAGPEEQCASDLWYADWLKLTQLQAEIKAIQERDKITEKNDQVTGMAFRLQQQIPVGYKWDDKKLRFVKIPTTPAQPQPAPTPEKK